jgi:Serine/Threonine/Tyrosine Kinase found in polyvalent proteins
MMNAEAVEAALAANAMRGGKEHRVALLATEGRVIKVADVHALATESLFDYLTDLLLSNHYFGDDIRMLGCYELRGRIQLVSSQPYIDGIHPEWNELKAGLISRGLRDPHPRSQSGAFTLTDDLVGEVDVFDLHPNNVIRDAVGLMNPIDAHFYFPDRETRLTALRLLELDRVTGATALARDLEQQRR